MNFIHLMERDWGTTIRTRTLNETGDLTITRTSFVPGTYTSVRNRTGGDETLGRTLLARGSLTELQVETLRLYTSFGLGPDSIWGRFGIGAGR